MLKTGPAKQAVMAMFESPGHPTRRRIEMNVKKFQDNCHEEEEGNTPLRAMAMFVA